MAEASVQFLLENLSSLIKEEIRLIMGVENEMENLSSTLKNIQIVLNDAEDKQFEDEAIRDWLRKLKDLVYEIEDIVDEYATEVSKAKLKTNINPARCFKNILYRSKIGRRMKEVTEKIDQTVAQKKQILNLREGIVEEQIYQVAYGRETSPVLNVSHPVYGRDEDKEIIVDILINQMSDCEELSVLPIIGMGGLGKTTLAQLVFKDQRVTDHFETKLWVCVSDDFDCKTLIKAILKSTSENESSNLDSLHLEGLQNRLFSLLSNKKYLLVLDDVWNEDQEKWDVLKSSLACGSSGASIVVTTRLPIVADIMSTLPAHQLTELSEEDCWSLFKQHAFKNQEEEHPNLETIGKEIVKKCGGVPLAAKSLGGLLRFKRSEKEWINVKESEVWELSETTIMPALRLSYKHLSSTLKQCFSFCAIFPKDTWIKKDELILMWISHGYISSSKTMKEEDIGDGIWNELALRGLFQDITTERYSWQFSDIIKFKMHDLVHDLAQTIMEDKAVGTQVEINNRSAALNTKVRQVNLNNCSVAFPTNTLPSMDLTSAIKSYTRLRILNASRTYIKVLPSAIGKLKHLRSLDLSFASIKSLPDAICSLWNLKILNLNYCSKLVSLPKKMKEMRNLRHLFLERCRALTKMPPSIGELSSLQTLSLFIVGHKKTNDQLKELEGLNLGGVLEIQHLERVKSFEDAKKANLSQKQNLFQLILRWGYFEVNDNNAGGGHDDSDDEKVFEALQPHPNLKRLEVIGFKGSNFPVWMGNLQNVVQIQIDRCPNCLCLPQVLGELPHLEGLVLKSLLLLQYILEKDDTAAGGQVNTLQTPKFPQLKYLSLENLENLKGMLKKPADYSREIIIFPNLQKLHISDCPEFVELNPEEIKYFQNTLEILELSKLPKMISLPDSLQHLTSLKELTLSKLPLLTSLPDWLGNTATSLYVLTISDCPSISSLPDTIQEMQNLEILNIRGCPELQRRCEKEKGEDWPKIAHIQYLHMSTSLK